jgi:HK97 family phage major capsid protein
MQERCAQLDGLLTEHNQQLESARAFADLSAKIDKGREDSALQVPDHRAPAGLESTSPGRAYVESDAFKAYPGRGQGKAFEVENYLGLEGRAIIATANLAIQPFVWAPIEAQSTSPLVEVMGKVRVSSGVVEWVEIGGDPTGVITAEGVAKTEAALTFTPVSATLDTIAHWVQITRQALADASYIQSLIENKLRRGLLKKVEADAAALLLASTSIQTASTSTAAGGNMSKSIRTGIGKVESAGYTPNAVALNPTDYANLDIASMSDNEPVRRAQFWGLTPVPVSSITAGNAYVGDFSQGLTLFDRGVSDVFVTDSHSDFFIKNLLVILAETRVKAAITEPLALCECTVAA